jgi:hypothetical protein
MDILRGYVASVVPGFARVRRSGGGIVQILNRRGYKGGENVVLLYDRLRHTVIDSYTSSEWDAMQRDVDLDERPTEELDNEEDSPDCEPWIDEVVGGFSETDG